MLEAARGGGADRRVLLAFAGTALLAGSNIVAVVFSNRELPPFWGAGIRFVGAGVLMLALVRVLRLSLPRGRALAGATFYGVLSFFVAYATFYWGTQEVPAGIASVIMGAVPLLTLLLALVIGMERFHWRGLVGALLAVGGITVISAEPPGGSLPVVPLLAIVAAATAAAGSGIVVKSLAESHPVTTNAVAMLVGAALLLATSAIAGERATLPTSAPVWTALVFLVLATPALFVLFVYILQRWTASAASYQFVLFPLVSIVLAAALLREPVSTSLLIGAPLVLAGVYVGALRAAPTGSAEFDDEGPTVPTQP
jgi:drug/metabolite transporter (DMT)-like permease